MVTKNQIIKYIELREKHARELMQIFKNHGSRELVARYKGELELAVRLQMLIRGDLNIEDYLSE
jgi:hypothetical protein